MCQNWFWGCLPRKKQCNIKDARQGENKVILNQAEFIDTCALTRDSKVNVSASRYYASQSGSVCVSETLAQQFSSVTQLCPTLCDPMNCSTPGLPVHHQLPEFTQTHVHWVGDAIQPSHPLSSPSPPALNPSQHQGLFKWVSFSHQVARVLEFQLNSSPCFIKLGHQQFLSVIWKKESNDLLRKGYWNAVNITYDELSHSISCSMGGLRGHWKAHWWGKCQHPWKAL